MRALLLILVLISLGFTQSQERTDRLTDIEIVDVSSGVDSTILNKHRAVKSDVDGKVKLLMISDEGRRYHTVEYLLGGVWHPVGNILKAYRVITTGSDTATTQVYDSTGVLITGVKVGK